MLLIMIYGQGCCKKINEIVDLEPILGILKARHVHYIPWKKWTIVINKTPLDTFPQSFNQRAIYSSRYRYHSFERIPEKTYIF